VRRVARQAGFVGLYRRVLENEWTHRVRVALRAHGKLSSSRAYLMACLCSVRIVAVAALHETNIDAVTVGTGELRLLAGMATEAQVGLRFHQHEVHVSGLMRTVTRGATHSVGQVSRLGKILGFEARLVASRANRGGLRRCESLKADDLGYVSTTVDMRLRRTVTGLTSVLIAFQQRGMGSRSKVLFPELLVAGLADGIIRILPAGLEWRYG